MKYLSVFLLLLIISSCKNETNNTEVDNIKVSDSTKITSEDISKINYIDFGIDSKAKEVLNSWEAYNTISRALETVKTGNFEFFMQDDDVFNTALKDLDIVPEAIDTEPIKARLLILKTKLLKFRAAVNLKTTSKTDKLIAIKELLQSFSYVTLQINKKFEKEAQNIIKPDSL